MNKKRIALTALGDNGNWTGGLYYIRNIAFELSQNSNIIFSYDIYIFAKKSDCEIFRDLKGCLLVEIAVNNKFTVIHECVKKRIDYLFPYGHSFPFGKTKSIAWIPDFQHNHFPELFTSQECKKRTKKYKKYFRDHRLILSSYNSLQDAKTFYMNNLQKVSVMHFVSYIEPEILHISGITEAEIVSKYSLEKHNYVCVMNQFWQHKNHMIVLRAMKEYFKHNPDSNIKFVFTGKLEDYRAPQYIKKLKVLFEEREIKKHSVLLGFIDRNEQIALMKNARYVIQPSLFEGWGTVVEDAKVLDKTILLSDIAVHREQMNEKCILFDPTDPIALAKLIEEENKKEHVDDIEAGITSMYIRANEYSKSFEYLLDDIERKR